MAVTRAEKREIDEKFRASGLLHFSDFVRESLMKNPPEPFWDRKALQELHEQGWIDLKALRRIREVLNI